MMTVVFGLFAATVNTHAQEVESSAIWAAQFVSGGGYTSRVTLKNRTDQDKKILFLVPHSLNQTLRVSVNGGPAGYVFYFTVPAAGSLVLDAEQTEDLSEFRTGYVHVSGAGDWNAAPNVEGELAVSYNGQQLYTVPVALARNSHRFEKLNHNPEEGVFAALSVANKNWWPFLWPHLYYRVYDTAGNLVAEVRSDIKPGQQKAGFVNQVFAGNPEWEAYLALRGGKLENFTLEVSTPGVPSTAMAFDFLR